MTNRIFISNILLLYSSGGDSPTRPEWTYTIKKRRKKETQTIVFTYLKYKTRKYYLLN